MCSKPPQFQPLLKYWGHLKNFYSNTTNCGVHGKNSPSTPQIVVSMAKIRLWHHKMWCPRLILGGIPCKNSTSTPHFVVSKENFCNWHHNLWCRRQIFAIDTIICGVRVEIFQVPPIFQQGLKLWGFGKQKVIWKTLLFNQIIKKPKCFYYLIVEANKQAEESNNQNN